MDAVDDLLHARLDAGVQAEGQAVTLAVDGGDDAVDLVGLERRDMQHRPENLALHLADAGNAEDLRRDEAAGRRRVDLGDQPALAPPSRRNSREIAARASSSMTGPTSVEIDQGSPTVSSSIAPFSISTTFFSTSFWT